MPRLTLYTGPLSMFGMKVEIALNEKGLPFERIEVPYNAKSGYDPKHPDVVRVNPKRQVPVLIDGELELFDSTQIFEYLEDAYPTPAFWPKDVRARALARQLEHKADEIYFPHIIRLMGLQDKLSEQEAMTAIAAARDFYTGMEHALGQRPYLTGDVSYADIALFMTQLFGERMGATLTLETPNLIAWRDRMRTRPALAPVVDRLVAYLRANHRSVPAFMA